MKTKLLALFGNKSNLVAFGLMIAFVAMTATAQAFTVDPTAMFAQAWDTGTELIGGPIGAIICLFMVVGAFITIAMTGRLLIPGILILAAGTLIFIKDIVTGLGYTLPFIS